MLGLACRVCPGWPAGLDGVRSAVELDPQTRRVVHRLKYEGWPRLAAVMAVPMAGVVGELAAGADLVPIPVSRARRRRRGYNQAEALAHALGAVLGRPVRPDRLARPREAGSQVRLGRAARQANLASAFAAAPSARPALLVDDVFTTGATLVSAAAALLDAGADRVAAVTFARARPPLAEAADRLGTLIHPSTHETL